MQQLFQLYFICSGSRFTVETPTLRIVYVLREINQTPMHLPIFKLIALLCDPTIDSNTNLYHICRWEIVSTNPRWEDHYSTCPMLYNIQCLIRRTFCFCFFEKTKLENHQLIFTLATAFPYMSFYRATVCLHH